jgi:REP element-mobilizing transposase RayT
VPRLPRYRRAPGSLEPGQLYHVTNRGVDRCDIFHSDLDRILFLSFVAEACLHFGAACHAWCLMTTHWHLVLEDTNGMLSQILHRFESTYARYFNDTRPRRRGGPLFESRFRAQLIDSTRYFEDVCAYVLLNPLETKSPMAQSAEAYRWSSAALVCCEITTAASVAALIEPFGGVDAILAALPPSQRKASLELRRKRLEALASGTWLERDHLLAGRCADDYRQLLAARAALRAASREQTAPPPIPLAAARAAVHPATLASRPPFAGFLLAEVEAQIRAACDQIVPPALASPESLRDLLLYALHRFTSASLASLAKLAGIAKDAARRTLERIRADRHLTPDSHRVLWSLEWALRWRLRAAPHRP